MEAGSGPQLFERNAVERVLRTPAGVEHRRLPVAQRRDADSRVAFSLLTFFLAKQKTSKSPAGARPDLVVKGVAAKSAMTLAQIKPGAPARNAPRSSPNWQ